MKIRTLSAALALSTGRGSKIVRAMSEGSVTFHCDYCGKTFPWQAEMAGQRVRCVCGHVFVPRPIGVETDDYDLAPQVQPEARPAETIEKTPVLQYEQRRQVNPASQMLEK